MKHIGYLLLVMTLLIVGCSNDDELNDQLEIINSNSKYTQFMSANTKNKKIIAHNFDGGNQMHFGYYEKISGEWVAVSYTTSWENNIDWDMVTSLNAPNIYLGTIKDQTITKVLVGGKEAKINDVEAGNRFWYFVDKNKEDLPIKAEREDGSIITLKD